MAEKPKSQAHLWAIFIGLVALGSFISGNTSTSPASAVPTTPAPPDPVFGARPQFVAQVYAKDYLRAVLKDFDSMKDLEAEGPTPHTIGKGPKALNGYLVTFEFNAKNSFGAYTGRQRGAVLIKNERIVWTSGIE